MDRRSVFRSAEAEARIKSAYEEALAAWPADLERIELKTSLGRTQVLAAGAARLPPLVLLHGTLSNSSMWTGEIGLLARERRVYALDIPGEPGLSEPYRGSWRGGAYPAWLEECLEALGLPRPGLLGLSLGAWIGLSLAVSRPGRLGALALLCPSGIGPARASFLLKALLASLRGRRGRDALNASLYGRLPPPPRALELGELFSSGARPSLEPIPLFSDEELRSLDLPLLLLVGALDPLLDSRASAQRLGKLQPSARIRLIPEAGHALLGLGGEVLDFFKAAEAAGARAG